MFQEPSPDFKIPEGALEFGATLEERRSWNVAKFAETYKLKLVGANFLLLRSAPAQTEA